MNSKELHDTSLNIPLSPTYHHLHPESTKSRLHVEVTRKDIKVLSYNIFLRPPPAKNNESDHKNDRLREFAKIMQNFDVICLQEMFGLLNKRKHKLINFAKKNGFLYHTDSPSPSFFSSYIVDGGLLILSRFPILFSEFKSYTYGVYSDSLSQKGVLYAKIQIKDAALHIFNTHTQATYAHLDQNTSVMTRGDQFLSYRKFMDECLEKYYQKTDLVLLVGDYNVDSRGSDVETKNIPKHPAFTLYPELSKRERMSEYDSMICTLSENGKDTLLDHLMESYGEHPVTFGASEYDKSANSHVPLEVVLTCKDDLCSNQSLDYIFELKPIRFREKAPVTSPELQSENTGELKVKEKSAFVENFAIEGYLFKQLSDHFGVSILLEYSDTLELSTAGTVAAELVHSPSKQVASPGI